MKRSMICGVVGTWLSLVGTANAEDVSGIAMEERVQPVLSLLETSRKEQEAFAQGSWALQLAGSYFDSDPVTDHEVQGGTANLAVGYYVLDRLGLYGELAGYALEEEQDEESDAIGAGFNLMLRWHFLQVERFSLYVDGSTGLVDFDSEFPSGGTAFNFIQRVGLGATYQLAEQLHLLGGVRYVHLSNADIEGEERNPSFETLEYYVGVMFTF